MLVSTKGRYALRVLLELAEHEQQDPGAYMCLDCIAESQGISEKYLESIVSILVKAKMVAGQRGRGGGYRLTRSPDQYSVGEVLHLTEGSLAPVSCLGSCSAQCDRAAGCRTLPMWRKLDDMIGGYLNSVTLLDLLEAPLPGDAAADEAPEKP